MKRDAQSTLDGLVASVEIGMIYAYRGISWPMHAALQYVHLDVFGCRYQPSCSRYTEEAIREWGPWKGVVLGAKRILRCSPYGGHGYDPVPKNMPTPGSSSSSGC
jgi:putative membrane protein insertion efficiency factor